MNALKHTLLFLHICNIATAIPFGPTMRNTVMSAIQDSADFAIKIHPPKEDTQETLRSLDGIMMLEDALRRATIEDFADAEQRLLKVHKAKIKQLVADAMEPIHAMLHLPSYASSNTGEL